MLEDKQGVSILMDDVSSKLDRKTINDKIKKIKIAKRTIINRPKNMKLSCWYEKAALSMAIKR